MFMLSSKSTLSVKCYLEGGGPIPWHYHLRNITQARLRNKEAPTAGHAKRQAHDGREDVLNDANHQHETLLLDTRADNLRGTVLT